MIRPSEDKDDELFYFDKHTNSLKSFLYKDLSIAGENDGAGPRLIAHKTLHSISEYFQIEGDFIVNTYQNKTIDIEGGPDYDKEGTRIYLWDRLNHDGQRFSIEYTGEDITKVPTMSRFYSSTVFGIREGIQFVIQKPSPLYKTLSFKPPKDGKLPAAFDFSYGGNDEIFFMHKRSKTIRNFKYKDFAITREGESLVGARAVGGSNQQFMKLTSSISSIEDTNMKFCGTYDDKTVRFCKDGGDVSQYIIRYSDENYYDQEFNKF